MIPEDAKFLCIPVYLYAENHSLTDEEIKKIHKDMPNAIANINLLLGDNWNANHNLRFIEKCEKSLLNKDKEYIDGSEISECVIKNGILEIYDNRTLENGQPLYGFTYIDVNNLRYYIEKNNIANYENLDQSFHIFCFHKN